MWKQVRPFNLSKMGKQKGMCLKNVRLAFDIPALYADAKAAMEANKKAGTLHPMSELPSNVAVPVFVDTTSKYEHVEVCDLGTYYSDGAKVTNPSKQKFFGWGETLNNVRIVEYVKPTPTPAPKPVAKFKVGDKVIPLHLVDISGKKLRQYDPYYVINQIKGNRVVLAAIRNGHQVIWAALNENNIRKV